MEACVDTSGKATHDFGASIRSCYFALGLPPYERICGRCWREDGEDEEDGEEEKEKENDAE